MAIFVYKRYLTRTAIHQISCRLCLTFRYRFKNKALFPTEFPFHIDHLCTVIFSYYSTFMKIKKWLFEWSTTFGLRRNFPMFYDTITFIHKSKLKDSFFLFFQTGEEMSYCGEKMSNRFKMRTIMTVKFRNKRQVQVYF